MSLRPTTILASALAALLLLPSVHAPAQQQDYSARLKDIADFEGVRDNVLVGYGLVVGLNRTGDTISNSVFTRQSLLGMLDRLGVNAKDAALKTQNTAAVIVTATLPPFARPGSRVDIVVSALGDAKSLLGGTLLVTALLGADGEVYAVAQGPLAVGGFSAEGAAASVTRGVPTSARIPNGAIVERSVGFSLRDMKAVTVALRSPDFTTASRVSAPINAFLGGAAAETMDSGTIRVAVPAGYPGGVVALMTEIEKLTVVPDQHARVVINEENGVIVINQDVKIAPVAIAQGSLTVRITETPQVSQPSPFSSTGTTTTVNRTEVQVTESGTGRVAMLARGASLRDLVNGLNSLGVSPRDLIGILQTLKSAGALRADLEVR
ncbi:MAG: flagellar basal body P-ring protein FlgI [Alphaproteobacteria bacterium]